MKTGRIANPLALAVLALLFERPMHPYEMASTLKERHKHESIKLRYGSLYTVIELMLARGLIVAKETGRQGKRPERTVYRLTTAGFDELRDWMRELLRDPEKDYSRFEAALSLMPVLPPDEVVALLRTRALQLSGKVWQMEGQLAEVAQQDIAGLIGQQALPAALIGQKFPPLFAVEAHYRLALTKAELEFVNELVRRIVEEGWGPRDLWHELQASAARQHEEATEPSAA